MTKQLIGVVFLVAGSVVGCATSPTGRSSARDGHQHLARDPGDRHGPTAIHAYAGFDGGEIYTARAATGSDADCARTQHDGTAVAVPADRVISVTVPAGDVACLRTQTVRGYELLWHALAQQPMRPLLADMTDRRAR